MEEKTNDFQQKLNEWLIKAGNFTAKQMQKLLILLQRFWAWYKSINWPDIPLTAFQWVLLFYILFGTIFLVSTPVFEASDELWHFGMVEYIRENDGALPEHDVSDPDRIYENNGDTIYRQEASQPPLYYYTVALLSLPFDISDAEQYREPNPHVRAGETGSWGNKNLVLHAVDGVPLSGTPLAAFVIRALGLVMGTVTIWAVWKCGELIAPHRPVVGLLAGVLTAFNPMFLFISASVNNDTMVIMLNSVVILLGLQMMREGFDTRRSLLLAVLLALATLTKLSALVLVPVIALGALWVARRNKDWTGLLILGGAMLIAWATISGMWYWRNIGLYGELFGTQTMAAVAGLRPDPFTIGTFLAEFESFRQGYWGVFGAFNIITSPVFYVLADFIVFIGIFGVMFLVSQLVSIQDFSFARREISLVLFLLGIVLLGIIAYLNWTSMTLASQGRLLFPFFAAISPLLAVGLIEVLWWMLFLLSPPDRSFVRAGDAVPEPILRESLQWPLRIFGLMIFVIPLFSIMPQYRPPAPIFAGDIPAEAETIYARYDNIELIAYDRTDRRYFPGETVRLTLYWRVIESTEEDLTVALALINPFEDEISERTISSYPGAGTLRTSTWEAGEIYADTYEIPLRRNLTLRFPFRIDVNWYDADPDNRIASVNNDGNPISVLLDVGAIVNPSIRVLASGLQTYENAEDFERNFGGSIILKAFGYTTFDEDLTFNVEALWQSQTSIDRDYIAFMHIYDAEGTLITQDDFQPQLPTRYWHFGDDFRLTYFVEEPETGFAPGEYTVNVGWYDKNDPTQRLIIQEGVEEEETDSFEVFRFTVEPNGAIVLPPLDLGEDTGEPQDVPLPPVRLEETPEVELTAEATPEVTPEATEEN